MRFDSFIQALDMGLCEDQLERQALFDLALMFVMIDGVVDDAEKQFMRGWLKSIPWTAETSKDLYYDSTEQKCQEAIQNDQVDDFIAHRARMLHDPDVRMQALKLADDIAHVDGHLDDREQAALNVLKELLED